MTSSESDSENDFFDIDAMGDFDDGMLDLMNDSDDEDPYSYEDEARHTEIRNAIMGQNASDLSNVPKTDIPEDYSIRLAMNSQGEFWKTSDLSKPVIDDSLRMYLAAPPLVRKAAGKNKACLAIDPTIDDSQTDSLSKSQLFVGNVSPGMKSHELRNWFISQGFGVSEVTHRSGNRFCFVRFDSIATARDVLYKSKTNSSYFTFQGISLLINLPKQSTKQPMSNPFATMLAKFLNLPDNSQYQITDIYYGTLITGAAMKNLHGTDNNAAFGIIAQRLIDNDVEISYHLHIDTIKKKLAIVGIFNVHEPGLFEKRTTVKFEWNFHDLKGRKITPVLINQNHIYLLLEIKRAPTILDAKVTDSLEYIGSDETRLPGNVLIGHANAWLFKLSAEDLRSDYIKLFTILSRQNLSARQFSGEMIVHLMSSTESIRRNFHSIQLVSNDEWIKQNQIQVNQFFQHRWPSYPFETKFEIMKLLSKHVITVNDLIIDQQAEEILKRCTMNTLVAVTDHIVQLAPQWFHTTCDYEREDSNTEINEENMNESEETVPIITDDRIDLSHLRSSVTGEQINHTDLDRASSTTVTRHLGTFSRLLLCVLDRLSKRGLLCILQPSGAYATKLELRVPSAHSFLIRKIYITPSTIFYEGPYREEKCAVTRAYEKYQDRFIRVTFRDEDYGALHDYNDNMSKMYERIKEILKNGANICDRNYQFLAFSSSQLREHSCWMFAAPNAETTVDTIRRWLGDFSNIHPVAKYAARLGQLFSTSIRGLELQSNQFKETPDYEKYEVIDGHSRKHCFTDGIGIISKSFAKKLAQQIKLSDGISYPSAFQIRCGGYKGMLCIDTFNCIKEPNIDIYFRPSMNKFPTDNYSIDVVRTSHSPTVAFLNRQIILLLSALGIPKENFIYLQNHMLEQLADLTKDPQNAIRSLKDLNEFGGNGFHAFLIAYLRRLGQFKDPFVWRVLHVIKAFLIKELRTKSKIRVQDSWSLLGVIDESETLKYGQVFIQIDTTHQQRENPIKEIFQGPVIVTRNPCFHPGDIRKLEAVDLPAFHHLKNVIVFPKHGPRSHPTEMSGGDLDGDTFWISRHPKLIFSRENEQPFDYQGQDDEAKQSQASSSSTKHTIQEVCNFFGEYIAADNLGLIANSHLVFADQSPQGVMSEKCLELARMHSTAVDFAKNGVSAPRLKHDFRPKEYPSYMEKKDKTICGSKTVLGELYDQVKLNQDDLYINETDEINLTASFPYKVFFIKGSIDYMKEARIIKEDYDRDVKRIMRQYGIRHEVEFISGYILKFTSTQYIRETKLFDLRNDIRHAYRLIQDRYLAQFWQIFYRSTGISEDEDQMDWSKISSKLTWKNQLDLFEFHSITPEYDEVEKKASAWFRVTYEPWLDYIKKKQPGATATKITLTNPVHERYRGLFSFAWLVYPILLRIFQQREDTLHTDQGLKRKRKTKTNKKKKKARVSPK